MLVRTFKIRNLAGADLVLSDAVVNILIPPLNIPQEGLSASPSSTFNDVEHIAQCRRGTS